MKEKLSGKGIKRGLFSVVFALVMALTLLPINSMITYAAQSDGRAAAVTPLTFTAEDAGATMSFEWKSGNNVQIKASSANVNIGGAPATGDWQDYTAGTAITLTAVGDSVSFKAEKIITYNNTGTRNFIIDDGKIAASGDVTSLTNGRGGNSDLESSCYVNLFRECKSLTSAPKLPSTKLTYNCYGGMFADCTSLTSAPALPATSLTNWCYNQMFQGCTSLTSAPALPATSLTDGCYNQMFQGCTSLTTAPALPATSLAVQCYRDMFNGCTSLTSAPELPSTELENTCYADMFAGCTSLTSVPALPATSLADYCYYEMFKGCTSLTSVTALPATSLATQCYYGMFKDCTSIKINHAKTDEFKGIWKIPAQTEASGWNTNMFEGCTGVNLDESGDKTVELNREYYVPHEHEFEYSAKGSTITAICSVKNGCALDSNKITLTLSANDANASNDIVTKTDLFGSIGFDAFNTATGHSLSLDSVKVYARNDTSKTDELTEITENGWYVAELTANKTVRLEFPVGEIVTVTFDANGHGTNPDKTKALSGETIRRPSNPTERGYRFVGWYKEAECENAWDFYRDTVSANITLYARWDQNSGSSPTPAPDGPVTIPVEGNDTVQIDATVKDGNAAVNEITTENIEKVVEGSSGGSKVTTITIDVSAANQKVNSVTLTKSTVDILAKTAADGDNKVETIEVKLSNASVEFDKKAIGAINNQAGGNDVKIVVDNTKSGSLNTSQQEAIKDMDVSGSFEAYVESNGDRIHDFEGGKAIVSIRFNVEPGRDAKHYHVYYVSDTGKLQKYATRFINGILQITTTHFSDYVIVYDESEENDTDKSSGKKDKDKDEDEDKDDGCTHSYGQFIVKAPTLTADGITAYKCANCGKLEAMQPISAYKYATDEAIKQIKAAPQGAVINIDYGIFNTFPKALMEEIKARPDLTITFCYTTGTISYERTVNAGAQLPAVLPEYAGPLFLNTYFPQRIVK